MKTATIFLTMLMALLAFSISAAESYTVDTKSKLNMRSGPGTSYSVVTQMAPGDTVKMLDEKTSGKWVKVKYKSKEGYVMKRYLASCGDETLTVGGKKLRFGHDPHNEWLLWVIVALFGAALIVACCDIENRFIVGTVFLALPAAIILYTKVTQNAMWFCDPDIVGWFYTIVNVCLLMAALSAMGVILFNLIVELIVDFNIIILLMAILFAIALFYMVITAFTQLLIVAVLMILGAGSGGYVGTFIDADGNIFDIFRR